MGKRALLVGINRYRDDKVSNLRYSINDVTATHKILTNPSRGGFEPKNCVLMTDKSRKKRLEPIRSNMMSSIKALSKSAGTDDYILFFFSGHGIPNQSVGEKERHYLLPADARINVLGDSAVPIDWIKKTMGQSKAKAKVLILDACHSGAIKHKSQSGMMTKGFYHSIFEKAEGFAILSSCKMDEYSWEMSKTKHGVFTYFLNEGLIGNARTQEGKITVQDACNYATEKTLQWADNEGVEQSPNLQYNVVGEIVLVSVPGEDDKVEVEKEALKQDLAHLEEIAIRAEDRKKRSPEALMSRFCAFMYRHWSDPDFRKVESGKCDFEFGSFHTKPPVFTFPLSRQNESSEERILNLIEDFSFLDLDTTRIYYSFNLDIDFSKVTRLEEKSKMENLMVDHRHGRLEGTIKHLETSYEEGFNIRFHQKSISIESPEKAINPKDFKHFMPSRFFAGTGLVDFLKDEAQEKVKPKETEEKTDEKSIETEGKCPKCGTTVLKARKIWTMAGRPDKDGTRLQLKIGLFDCPKCGAFRKALSKKKV